MMSPNGHLQIGKTIHGRHTTSYPQKLQHPIVIPQTTKAFRGAFFSPFCRAVPDPGLEAHGIDNDAFLACIDGLNETFIAHPVFQATGVVGGVMSMFYGVHPIQWAGTGLQAGSGVASAATSYLRTKAYIKALNTDLFHPAGLNMKVQTTKKMLETVGYSSDKLELPATEIEVPQFDTTPRPRRRRRSGSSSSSSSNSSSSSSISSSSSVGSSVLTNPLASTTSNADDPRMRRLRALEGHVMPLNFDVPPSVTPDNLLRRMGNAQAEKQAKKQGKEMAKTRRENTSKLKKTHRKAAKNTRRTSEKIRDLEEDIANVQAEFERTMTMTKHWKSEKDKQKTEKEFRQRLAKLQAKLDECVAKGHKKDQKHADKVTSRLAKVDKKEDKVAQKIRWVVIHSWQGEEDEVNEMDDGPGRAGENAEW